MNTVTHKDVSGLPADPDPTLIDGPKWDKEHIFAGGQDGDLLTYASAQSDRAAWMSPTLLVRTDQFYDNPPWIRTLDYAKLTNVPAVGGFNPALDYTVTGLWTHQRDASGGSSNIIPVTHPAGNRN